jgi:hypothetical protein
MFSTPAISTWITVGNGCPIRYQINGSDEMEFACGSGSTQSFGLTMHSEALRQFLIIGTEALRKMDALHAEQLTPQSPAARA